MTPKQERIPSVEYSLRVTQKFPAARLTDIDRRSVGKCF
jgi:hypothetical protein